MNYKQSLSVRLMGTARGGALLWVLVLLSVGSVSLLATGATQRLTEQRDKERELLFVGRQFQRAIEAYIDESNRRNLPPLPKTVDELLLDNRSGQQRRHLRKLYVDPITGTADWGLIRTDDGLLGVHSLARGKPLKKTDFPIDLVGFERAQTYLEWKFLAKLPVKPN